MKPVLVVGSLNADLVLRTERMPLLGETLPVEHLLTAPGGKGMNQAVAIARLGGRPVMVGCLGRDDNGEFLLSRLTAESIDTRWIRRTDDVATGMAVITVTRAGENSILVYPGANQAVEAAWVLSALEANPSVAALVLQMEIPVEVVFAAIEEASRRGIPVVLNPSPYKPIPAALLPRIDTLVVNEIEAAQLLGAERDPRDSVAEIRKCGVRQAVVTCGAAGVFFNDGEAVRHVPARKVEVVDPTAAGDTFLGAYVAALSKGRALREAMAYAVSASALAVTRIGAQPSIPRESEVQ